MTQTPHRGKIGHICTVDLTARFLLLRQLESLANEGLDVCLICAPGPWISQVEERGIRHIPWTKATRAWDPAKDTLAAFELLRILRKERFDLVHTHNPKPGLLGRVVARLAGVPNIINTVHGFYVQPHDRWLRRLPVMWLERLAARCSDLELYQSKEDLEWAQQLRVSTADRRAFLGNGTDLSKFSPSAVERTRLEELRTELSIPQDSVVIGTVGRIVEEKGYREFFEAARHVKKTVPQLAVLAVGDMDPDKADAIGAEEAARAGVIVTGWRENVAELIALMDVFVLASWREGVPRSAIEAAALQRPMVLTDVRGCREVARHEKEALLVPPRDPGALSAAILRLIREPALSGRLAAAARERAVERFDEEQVARRVVEHTGHLLRRSGRWPLTRSERVDIRYASPGDAAGVARLHMDALPTAFLPKLGARFLTNLYKTMVRDPGSVVLAAERDGVVVGFVAGTLSVGGLYRRFLIRRGLPAAAVALPKLLRPPLIKAALETASYPRDSADLPEQELVAIGVNSAARGQGIARKLGQVFLEKLRELGAEEVKVVVAVDNNKANALYERLGFERLTEIHVHGETRSNVWIKRWSSPSASSLP